MPVIPSTLGVLLVGGYFLYRRADVRLVLMLAAAAMFLVRATQPGIGGAVERVNAFAQLFTEFAKGMTSPNWVLPICSAMGFAYVCKLTDCDAHLVHLLCRPLKHVRWLLIPGGVTVAFFVNAAIISQTSTASVVGPVLIPLLVTAGYSRQTAGAMLLLGSSMGGELLNPAAVEVTAISKVTGLDNVTIIRQLLPYNLLACGTAMLVFWAMAMWRERRPVTDTDACDTTGSMGEMVSGMATVANVGRINPIKAVVPLVPVMLLIFVRPWLKRHGVMADFTEQTAIGGAMLVGVVCAAATSPGRVGKVAAAFFEGAGFAYAQIVSMIVAAVVFAQSIQVNGLVEVMAHSVDDMPTLVMVAAIVLPWLLAVVTGTAVGSVPLLIAVLVPVAMKGVEASAAVAHGVRVGTMNSIVAQYGRTTSPVAPIANFCATLVRTRPTVIIQQILVPLIAGSIVLLIAALLRVW